MTRRPRRKVWIIFPALNLIASITVLEPCEDRQSCLAYLILDGHD